MKTLIGIRREDKNIWERRVPLVPTDLKELQENHRIEAHIQSSKIRIFSDDDYQRAGATTQEDLSPCKAIFALKELPIPFINAQSDGKVYTLFAHVIKGQQYNMPMLQRLLDKKATLIDYEKVEDSQKRRLLFFGNYAGLAGMHITLWALGQRLTWEGIPNPFSTIQCTSDYKNLESAENSIKEVGAKIKTDGLPSEITPFVCGFAGYGNVSQGAQSIYDLLPTEEVAPADLPKIFEEDPNPHVCYKVVFYEKHMVVPSSAEISFELQDYYDHPKKYVGVFEQYVQYLTVLINGIYWEERYPRLVTKEYLRRTFTGSDRPRLRTIGDISCDVEGAIEATLRPSTPGQPAFTYDPEIDEVTDGLEGQGLSIMAIDNLPGLLPVEASTFFSEKLKEFVPAIANADYNADFEALNLPAPIKRALICHKGELTPSYRYLEKFLSGES